MNPERFLLIGNCWIDMKQLCMVIHETDDPEDEHWTLFFSSGGRFNLWLNEEETKVWVNWLKDHRVR